MADPVKEAAAMVVWTKRSDGGCEQRMRGGVDEAGSWRSSDG